MTNQSVSMVDTPGSSILMHGEMKTEFSLGIFKHSYVCKLVPMPIIVYYLTLALREVVGGDAREAHFFSAPNLWDDYNA